MGLAIEASGAGIADITRQAESGDVRAQFSLGSMYFEGKGVEPDKAKTVHWWRRAARAGNATAQFNMGGMYYNGEEVVQNDSRAYFWFLLAAAQGDEDASQYRDKIARRLAQEERARVQALATQYIESNYQDCVEP